MLRDKLLARLAEMGDAVDHQRLAAEVLGIRGAPPELAKRLVAQALVVEDRRDEWRRAGERICGRAPSTPGVYVLKDGDDRPLYVGKAVNLRRRLRAHFADRRWKAIKPAFARAAGAEWQEVGSELEALLREAALIDELKPPVNVQTASPQLDDRAIPQALLRDTIVVAPSVEDNSVELIVSRVEDGGWMIQRTRRNGSDLAVHANRLWRFFNSALRRARTSGPPLAPIVYSWLAGRGASATRLDPHAARSVQEMRRRLAALLRDERLFHERIEQW
ncbi:MAG TPA: nucleotide excision repair endonuclease [Vicinamibacterales bacterium]|nr:nucleotide excision repair endonuclease [Vicinamibacterales bacterium]